VLYVARRQSTLHTTRPHPTIRRHPQTPRLGSVVLYVARRPSTPHTTRPHTLNAVARKCVVQRMALPIPQQHHPSQLTAASPTNATARDLIIMHPSATPTPELSDVIYTYPPTSPHCRIPHASRPASARTAAHSPTTPSIAAISAFLWP
jgi:hypothetical protein